MIYLEHRSMRFSPWGSSGSDGGIDCSAVNEVTAYFVEQGGDLIALVLMLNQHIDDPRFCVTDEVLLGSAIPAFGPEFYLYLISFTKMLIGREDFRYGEFDDRELSPHHRICERGTLQFNPWYVKPEEYENKGFSLLNVRIPLRYVRERGDDSKELLEWFYSFMPEGERKSEDFFENDFYHLSDEACLLFHSLFEAFYNGRAALEDCFYRLYASPKISLWSQLIHPDPDKAINSILAMRKNTIASFSEDIWKKHNQITWEIRLTGAYLEQSGQYRKSGIFIGLSSNMGANRALLEIAFSTRLRVQRTRLFLESPENCGGMYVFGIRYWRIKRVLIVVLCILFSYFVIMVGKNVYGKKLNTVFLLAFAAAGTMFVSCYVFFCMRRILRHNRDLQEVCDRQFSAFKIFSRNVGKQASEDSAVKLRAAKPVSLSGFAQIDAEICSLVRIGLGSKEIAAQLFLSPRTIENRLHRIYKKMNVHSRTELLSRLHAYSHTADVEQEYIT